ncbi:transformer-2 protein homolog alpha isoform X4 [Schistocerca americana]|uniref:transformer-2 protein homolog alpha isoform X4 n=1 Tax=Schistocerca americana TaxID=7009 RepID=UPI001F4F374F|nr:transformer-2 protein homolog alpha isoform X4 [Schistocerca americana]XP_047110355.1 transformer-2 protein homolog alpha isoform X4 [Schistocerca piceifrons]XP_049777316.1 transformer-2 protein homolog alpha isoform X4 [Schistocerca cancellata]XP_049798282.1 transformer-2 protein homolog alpha-like isoform X4 [Schistocerca nitens]XP_049809679.1 transformer-2 protein homolog alpha-like isoform X4 [Schistocerca nitens]XP_049859090.1 transformer-2 protein homolog alpha-like isoform X4 [Schist
MSDREHSPSHSGSNHSPPANDKTPTPPNSREQSRSRSRSYSQHRSHHKGKSYSRSRSHSRPRKMSYRGRYRSRSRSRSPRRYRSRYSHSRSRSYSPRGKYYGYSDRRKEFYRSHSRSPMSSRRRHIGSRENPQPSRCLGIFGLSIYTTEQQLHHIMSKYGPVERVQVVIDAKTGRSRGFSFVYFESAEDAKVAKEQCTGMEIDGRRIRVDFSITQRAHTPTPGIYMGKPTYDYYGGYRGGGGYRGRSPSPYYRRRRYERSRSRSYSPRRY